MPVPDRSGRITAAGCSNGLTTIPAGADAARISDVDGDGKPDTEFYSEGPNGFEYGIKTSAGGVDTLRDDLAGPGVHSGWTATVDVAVGHVTVLDDGRSATLHAFVGCRFVTTNGPDGQPYRFGLNGFYQAGTGVACSGGNGGVLVEGVLAHKRRNGNYDIRWTNIDISADGTKASNGPTSTRWADLAPSDPRVHQAMGSYCGNIPKVHTNGE
ncbi:hypothetical protein [Amnibacterium endophyticum]|uniref:VCBS repeat-containing protein n=1 Tax=Amnibacterium endophyticum TaxID=2109337 RepID=A0ABW4LHV3_9MICO